MMGKIYTCDTPPEGARCVGYLNIHRKIGYNFQIEEAAFPESLSQNEELSVDLLLSNIGVAPIYYNWDVIGLTSMFITLANRSLFSKTTHLNLQ
jgi:hypothetical protein